MLEWLKGKSKSPTVEELFENLRKCKKPAQQSGILSSLVTLASEDDQACKRMCELEPVKVLKTLDDVGSVALACALLKTMATRNSLGDILKLGEQGAVNFVVEFLGDEENIDLFPDLCTALIGLSRHHINKRKAKAVGIVTTLLEIFHKQEIEPEKMEYIIVALKAVLDLREDPIDDVSPYIPKVIYVMSTCVYGSEAPSHRHELQANLACELASFLTKSGSLASMMVDRGVLPLLVDMMPSNFEERKPAYLPNVLRCLVSISKSHDLLLESLPTAMPQKLENNISGALDAAKRNKSEAETGKVVRGMLNAWLSAQVVCALCAGNSNFMEKAVAGRCLRLLFDLLKIDFSQLLLRYGMLETEDMVALKRDLITTLEEICRSTRFHASVRASGGLGALTSFMSHSGMNSTLKVHAERAIWNLEHSKSKSPVSAGLANSPRDTRARRLTCESFISPPDPSDSTGLGNPYLRVSVGTKRKVFQASLGTESEDSERQKSRIFRQVPVFSSQQDTGSQNHKELIEGRRPTE